MARQLWIILVSLMSLLVLSTGAMADSQGPDGKPLLSGQRQVKGTVEQIKGDQLQINTGEAVPRFIPLKIGREKKFPEIKIGDTIELTVNDQNLLVDYHLLNESGQPAGQANHHLVKGKITQALAIGHDSALIRTENGKEQNFEIRTQARSKVASIPIGIEAVFMLDETNKIVDVNFANKEAAEKASKVPERKAPLTGAQQSVLGTVVKPLEGNQITIRTRDRGEQPFEVRPAMRSKMGALAKGKVVVLLLDGDNQVADVAVSP